MAEKVSHGGEKHEHFEARPSVEAEKRSESRPAESRPERESEKIETLAHQAEVEAKTGKEIKVDEDQEKDTSKHYLVTKDLKTEALKRNLKKARKQLSRPERTFSRVIHQPIVDMVSRAGEKTIARPRGLLTGAFFALIGSTYVFYMAKHYGFVYNYWVAIILFVGGYILGLGLDMLLFVFKRGRKTK